MSAEHSCTNNRAVCLLLSLQANPIRKVNIFQCFQIFPFGQTVGSSRPLNWFCFRKIRTVLFNIFCKYMFFEFNSTRIWQRWQTMTSTNQAVKSHLFSFKHYETGDCIRVLRDGFFPSFICACFKCSFTGYIVKQRNWWVPDEAANEKRVLNALC